MADNKPHIPPKAKRRAEVVRSLVSHNGHVKALMVRESDPETGGVVQHAKVVTHRVIDRLYWVERRITAEQHAAGETLRDLFERAGAVMSHLGAVDAGRTRVDGSPDTPLFADEDAHELYELAMRELGRDRARLVRDTLLFETHTLTEWGRHWRCDALEMLRGALDRLERFWAGYVRREAGGRR
jgi:hypothetical protein